MEIVFEFGFQGLGDLNAIVQNIDGVNMQQRTLQG
jgi:hypothetical protein